MTGRDKLCSMPEAPWYRDGKLGWAGTESQRDDQIERAKRLEGRNIVEVHYFTLDYGRMDNPSALKEPRLVVNSSELKDPLWRHDDFDSVDFYIQLDTDDQSIFTIGWDPPTSTESLWMREGSTGGEPFAESTSVAIWDVTGSRIWRSIVGGVVSSVYLRYRAWNEPKGFGCDLVVLEIGNIRLGVFLADVGDGNAIDPSTNNLIVLNALRLPDWMNT